MEVFSRYLIAIFNQSIIKSINQFYFMMKSIQDFKSFDPHTELPFLSVYITDRLL